MSDQTTEAPEPTEPTATAAPPAVDAPDAPETAEAAEPAEAASAGAATVDCRECGAAIRREAKFCPTCGTTQEPGREAPVVAVADDAARDAPAPAAPTAAAPARATPTTPGMLSVLLPRFPCKLVWSPRKAWVVSTSLPERRVTDVFSATMAKEASMLRRSNNYYRRVSWSTQRNAISGEVVATCRADGPVTIGAGRSKIYADVSGDTMLCRVERNEADGRNHVSIGVGTFTTWLGFYLFPPMTYSMDVIKALKQEDPSLEIRHPWSVFRIMMLVLVAIWVIVSAAGG